MADVAEPRGPAGTGAGGPVVAGTQFTAVADRTGASGLRRSETGEPVVTGIRFQMGNDIAEASGPAVTPGPVARSELERDSDQSVGLPGHRPEPEPVARS